MRSPDASDRGSAGRAVTDLDVATPACVPAAAAAATPALRACMLAYTFYETDGRVMRYAEALAERGAQVDAVVLAREGQPREEWIRGVRVLRIQNREKNERGRASYFGRILRFFFRSMLVMAQEHGRHPYGLVHVHSVPDFEIFAAWRPKLGGAKLILDIHDIVPEFYAAKFGVGPNAPAFKLLLLVERLSAAFADHVIAANDLWLTKLTARATRRDKCSVFINYPDTSIFRADLRHPRGDGRFVVVYPGSLGWHQGLDIAVRAVALARQAVPTIKLHIYGEGSAKPGLEALVDELGLREYVQLKPPLPLRAIAAVMASADVGVVPKRGDGFGGEAFSTKIMEFMALGVPLVAADTRIDRHYFDESMLRFFRAGDSQALCDALVAAHADPLEGQRRAARALTFVREHSWDRRKHAYLDIVDGLLEQRHG